MSPETRTAAAGLSSLLSLLELKKRVALVLLQLVSKAWHGHPYKFHHLRNDRNVLILSLMICSDPFQITF